MYNEIRKLKLKLGLWQGLVESTIPIDNAKCNIRYPDSHTALFDITENKLPVAKFGLSFMHGCRGILVSHSMLVDPAYRGLGIAKTIQHVKQRVAKDLKVSMIMSTVVDGNKTQEAVIKDWSKVGTFDNVRTGNRVNIFTTKVK